MSGLIDEFMLVLDEQANNFSDLLGLSLEKKDVIVNNDIEYLQKITSLENSLLGKNQKLEKKRLQLMQDIALVLNINPKNLTIGSLAELYKNKPERELILKSAESIRKSLDGLKTSNEQNKTLIEHSLDYIDFSMNLMRSSVSPQQTFFSAKGEEMDSDIPFFDAKQ